MKHTHFLLWAPVAALYTAIALLSSITGDQLASFHFPYPFKHFDKLVHGVEFSLLGMVLARALRWEEYYHHLKRHWYVYFGLIVPLIALSDEVHQYFIPDRKSDLIDWIVDVCGAIAGALIYVWYRNRFSDNAPGEPPRQPHTRARIQFFVPPVAMGALVALVTWRGLGAEGASLLGAFLSMLQEHPALAVFADETVWHGVLFFFYGLFFFRALLWESLWHKPRDQRLIWGLGVGLFGGFCFMAKLSKMVGNHTGNEAFLAALVGGGLALASYVAGYRILKARGDRHKKCLHV